MAGLDQLTLEESTVGISVSSTVASVPFPLPSHGICVFPLLASSSGFVIFSPDKGWLRSKLQAQFLRPESLQQWLLR